MPDASTCAPFIVNPAMRPACCGMDWPHRGTHARYAAFMPKLVSSAPPLATTIY